MDRFGGIASAMASKGNSSIIATSTSLKWKLAHAALRSLAGRFASLPTFTSSGSVYSRPFSPRVRNFSISGSGIGMSWLVKLKTRAFL